MAYPHAEPAPAEAASGPSAERGRRGARRGTRQGVLAALGAVMAAFLASLCCVGPLAFVALGLGAGLASTFEPFRPVFVLLTLAFLAAGFRVLYGASPGGSDSACGRGGACPMPRRRTRDHIMLWVAALLALVLLGFPQWSKLLV